MDKLMIFARMDTWGKAIQLAAVVQQGKRILYADNLTLLEGKEGEITQPFATLDRTAAQKLMDDLWDCGLRPSEGSGSAGAMLAVQNHLEDMRRLVFKEKYQK